MRRFLIVLLAIVLPLQFAWAGAAAYCGHEPEGTAARHWGHHGHAHQGSEGVALSAKADKAGKASSKHADKPDTPYQAPDLDCAVCHLAASAAVPSVADLTHATLGATARHPLVRALFRSAPDALPDRPQWLGLA